MKHPTLLLPAILIATLLAPLPGQHTPASDSEPLRAECYGRPSGTGAEYGAGEQDPSENGVILELIGGRTPRPLLRLFGGSPGNPAAIFISDRRDNIAFRGATLLVSPDAVEISGVFDRGGYFTVPLGMELIAEDRDIHAQGSHNASTRVLEFSNGLHLFRGKSDAELPFSLSDLPTDPSTLPANEAGSKAMLLDQLLDMDLVEFLTVTLNSSGDSVALDLAGTCNVPIKSVSARAFALKVHVKRTKPDEYLLAIDSDVTLTRGFELWHGDEAAALNSTISTDVRRRQTYRFHSVLGVSRAVHGLALAQAFPELSVGAFDESAFVRSTQPGLRAAKKTLAKVRQDWDDANERVANIRNAICRATERERKAVKELRRAVESQLPERARKALAKAVDTAREGVSQLRNKQASAYAKLERAQRKVDNALEMSRIAASIAQTRGYVGDHCIDASVRLDPEAVIQLSNGFGDTQFWTIAENEERARTDTPDSSFSLTTFVLAFQKEFSKKGADMECSFVWKDRDPLRGLPTASDLLRSAFEAAGAVIERRDAIMATASDAVDAGRASHRSPGATAEPIDAGAPPTGS